MNYVKMLSPAEAADRLNVSRCSIMRWIHSSKIPHVHVGPRLIKIPEQVIEDMINQAYEVIDEKEGGVA